MAEPKKPAGATHEAGPEEPTRYIEQQPMGEGEEGEGGKDFDYPPVEEADEGTLGGKDFDYPPAEEVDEEAQGGKSFDY
jgi:hypothetical protein